MLEKLIKRLQSRKIITVKGCWESNFSEVGESGHVQIGINGKLYYIHRVSAAYYFNLNYNDKSWLALHKNECHNPKCWNPEHLYAGSNKDNHKDSKLIGTFKSLGDYQSNKSLNKTHCPKGHPHIKKGSCPECNKIRVREFMRKKRNSIRRYIK